MLEVREIRRLELRTAGTPHLSAASGLVSVGRRLYVVADDELALGVFDHPGSEPGDLAPLAAGTLPGERRARKARKPDLETLAFVPQFDSGSAGALLALGSGSTARRERGFRWPLNRDGSLAAAPVPIDLSPLYEAVRAELGELNVEGACSAGAELLLFHRGVAGSPNAVLRVGRDLSPATLDGVRRYDLGDAAGVPYGFTDASAVPDGRIVFTAAAEDTGNSYDDGAVAGSAVGVLDGGGEVISFTPVAAREQKVEGVHAELGPNGIDLLLVCDPDDRAVAAPLLAARL